MTPRGAIFAGPATIVLAAAAGACGTVDWAFDSVPAVRPLEAGTSSSDGAMIEAGLPAEGGSAPEAAVAEAAAVEAAVAEASSWRDFDDARAYCTSDSDCPSASPHCDTGSGECVQCVTSADCGQGLACESLQCVASCAGGASCPAATPICNTRQACVPCTTNTQCANASTGTGRLCLTGTGQCVQCLSSSDCLEGFCSESTNACVP